MSQEPIKCMVKNCFPKDENRDLYGILHFGRVVLVNNIVTITIFWSDFHREVYYIVRVA